MSNYSQDQKYGPQDHKYGTSPDQQRPTDQSYQPPYQDRGRSPYDDNDGRPVREQEQSNWQHQRWPQEGANTRNMGRNAVNENYRSNESYSNQNYGNGNYGREEYLYGANPEGFYEQQRRGGQPPSPYRSSRGQHRGEPWPRNEDRENYAPVSEYGFGGRPDQYFDERAHAANRRRAGSMSPYGNQTDTGNYARAAGNYAQDAGYSQNYGNVQNWQQRDDAQTGAFGMQSHRGKGPRGYSRSDERIKEDICERLSEHHFIDASGISVEVKDGVVTLDGVVDDRWQKYQTEDLADATGGVKDINNRLTVTRAAPTEQRVETGDKSKTSTQQPVAKPQ